MSNRGTMISYQDVVRRYTSLPPGAVNATVDAIATALALTDEEIHLLTGISRPTINAMRCGRRPIPPGRLWPIASALDVEVEVLLTTAVDEAVCQAVRGRRWDQCARRFTTRTNRSSVTS